MSATLELTRRASVVEVVHRGTFDVTGWIFFGRPTGDEAH